MSSCEPHLRNREPVKQLVGAFSIRLALICQRLTQELSSAQRLVQYRILYNVLLPSRHGSSPTLKHTLRGVTQNSCQAPTISIHGHMTRSGCHCLSLIFAAAHTNVKIATDAAKYIPRIGHTTSVTERMSSFATKRPPSTYRKGNADESDGVQGCCGSHITGRSDQFCFESADGGQRSITDQATAHNVGVEQRLR